MTGRLQLKKIALAATVAIAGLTASAEEYTLPVTFTPNQTLFDQCEKVDVAGDAKGEGGCWTYYNGNFKYTYEQNKNNAADDWIILPLVNFGDVTEVTISFKAWTQTTGTETEDFSVFLGKSQDVSAMTVPVISKSDYVNTASDPEPIVASVKVPAVSAGESNEWCIGFHVTSKPLMYNLYIKDITIEAGASDVTVAPAVPVIESSAVDGLDYTASVKMPSANVDGDEITGSMSLKVLVDGYTQDTYTDLSAGEVKSVSLTLEEGEHTIGYQAILEDVASSLVTETVTAQKKVIT
ncbi:MAG: hypothetical protein K2H18_07640, partial [Muribaculaceae bacterium]|nr:hypothetical protein [Muribaculaceae bacterium]